MREERVRLATVAGYARSVLDYIGTMRRAFPLTVSARLPFLDIRVKLEEGTLAESIRRNFVQEAGDAPRLNTEAMEILVAHAGMEGVPPPASWADEPYHPHEIATRLDSEGLRASYFHDLDYWQILDVAGGFGVQLMREPDGYPPWEPCAPMRPFLHWHYARAGMRLAHCGTLGLNGAGVLLAGAGGAGKSGTVVAGLLNGLQSIGDDYVLLAASEDVVGYPVFAALKQDQAGFERLDLGNRVPAAGPLNWQGKYEFHLADVSSTPTPARLSMKALLVPRVGGEAKTRIEPVSRRDAMLAFAPSSIQQMPGERESGFAFFSRVARRLPCYTLSLGREPAEIAGRITEFLERNP